MTGDRRVLILMILWRYLSVSLFIVFFNLTTTPLSDAGSFEVSPIRVTLSPQTSSILISVRNKDKEKLRVQVETVGWNQSKKGEMLLAPTKDIAFYPSLLSMEPGEARKIRVAARTAVGSVEKTYRIFIAELPDATKTNRPAIRMLTRFSIPIFLQPEKSRAQVQVGQLSVRGREVFFELTNKGNSHSFPRDITINGIDARGGLTFENHVPPWYVLAGGAREFRGEIPKNECPKTTTISLHVDLKGKTLVENLQLPTNACML